MSDNATEHESFIKTPQQLIVVGLLSFTVPVILIIMLAQFVISASSPDASNASAEAVVARVAPVAQVNLVAGGGDGAFKGGEEIVKTACFACHGTGAAGAPKLGDKGAWAARISGGMDRLVQSALKGKGAMPAKGGSTDLSDFEIARAVVYLANQSGASFKEPAAPKPAAKK